MTKARRSHANRMMRSELRSFVAANWKRFLLVELLFIAGAVTMGGLTLTSVHSSGGIFLGGFAAGVLIAAIQAMIVVAWLLSGQGYSYAQGDLGESLTREELEKAKKAGLIFDWVDNIELNKQDIDHLVVSPTGVIAVETKFKARQVTAHDLLANINQSVRSARKAQSVLLSKDVAKPQEVRSLVVVWGKAPGFEEAITAEMAGRVIRGPALLDWLAALQGIGIDKTDGLQLVSSLEAFALNHRPSTVRR